MSLPDDIRRACARVAARPERVRLVPQAIDPYARSLPSGSPPAPDLDGPDLEARAAFSLTLNAVNFGSGWFPTLCKPPRLSGFRTVEAGLRARGPWTASELAAIAVELRACAVHAVELLVRAQGRTTAAAIDNALWLRGGGPRYKAVARHRARCTAY